LPLRARELPSNFFRFSVLLFTKTSGFQTLPFTSFERSSFGLGLQAFQASAKLPSFGGYSYVT